MSERRKSVPDQYTGSGNGSPYDNSLKRKPSQTRPPRSNSTVSISIVPEESNGKKQQETAQKEWGEEEVEGGGLEWKTGICSCNQDPDSCIDTIFCCYCQLGRQYAMIETHEQDTHSICLMACCLDMFCTIGIAGAAVTARNRLALMDMFEIDAHGKCVECLRGFFCACCATCQQYRELSARRLWPGGICITEQPMLPSAPIAQPTIQQQKELTRKVSVVPTGLPKAGSFGSKSYNNSGGKPTPLRSSSVVTIQANESINLGGSGNASFSPSEHNNQSPSQYSPQRSPMQQGGAHSSFVGVPQQMMGLQQQKQSFRNREK